MAEDGSRDDEAYRLRLELIATFVLAIATVLTAWSAFQSSKWSGVQAINFSSANAARTESIRASGEANALRQIDVNLFVDWVSAVADERSQAGRGEPYEPQPGTLSGFLFERFRDEFKPAVEAWLATDPINDPDAPSSPFALDEYQLEADAEAASLEQDSLAFRDEALTSNQRSDNYTLLTVLFASVLLFAGVSTKSTKRGIQLGLLALAIVIVLGAAGTMLTFPVEI
jgi:hypothetical protein